MITQRLTEQIAQLPLGLQRRVLDFAQALAISSPKGIPGKQLLRFAGTIDHDDIQAIEQAIEAECEKVDEFAISASALACGLDTAREYGVITHILTE